MDEGARDLLRRAREVFEDPSKGLASSAATAWRTGFASGGHWMRQALGALRGAPVASPGRSLNTLGAIKYGLATAAALLCVLGAVLLQAPLLALLCVPAFYAVEAQMVFLFPLVLDGHPQPFRESRRWTRHAGGTLQVMRVVMPVAVTMVLGGFLGRGFVRSWCVGCLAICVWYERIRTRIEREAGPTNAERPWHALPFEFGCLRPLQVRRETVALGVSTPLRVLYASDLHLGHWWTRCVPEQLHRAAIETRPDVILLGGDLVDRPCGLTDLLAMVRRLTAIAPVHAIPGNHDVCVNPAALQAAIQSVGGHWLLQCSIETPLRIDGALSANSCLRPRILCAHFPDVFPDAVAAGYDLVLAGHLHGGQCVLATLRDKLYPACWIHRWHGLRFAERGALLLVSRGVADTLPIRFNCPREVILCEVT